MPLYEFRCEECDDVTERLCRVGTTGKGMECPSCGARNMRRLMSVFSARSKGEGGSTTAVAGSSNCASCASSNCASCH